MIQFAELLFLSVMTGCALFLLIFSSIHLAFAFVYGAKRDDEPVPSRFFSRDELPKVTVQLPIRNEGATAERVIRRAAALDYPSDRLEIQVLDDSDDATVEIIDRTVAELRRRRPDLSVSVLHRSDREDFKAGALRGGMAAAGGDFFAIFDADFEIPPDFLKRTIHFFSDPAVGIVQGRWAYLNHRRSVFTRFQATKLDSHQMFDQTARARAGLWAHFHGSAGVLRRCALADAGGWDCISEVEDVEVSIRAHLRGTKTIYLDRLRVPSELPETVAGFLTQQMRWKRGWIRVLKHYWASILSGRTPVVQRLDILARLVNAFGPAVSLPLTIGALPTFMLAERCGLWAPTFCVYTSLLGVAVCQRFAEARFAGGDEDGEWSWTTALLPTGLIMNMGLTPAWTQGTFEGFGKTRSWEVTPKRAAAIASRGNDASPRVPSYIRLTIAMALAAAGLLAASLWTRHFVAGLFYALMLTGCTWVAGTYLWEQRTGSSLLPADANTRPSAPRSRPRQTTTPSPRRPPRPEARPADAAAR